MHFYNNFTPLGFYFTTYLFYAADLERLVFGGGIGQLASSFWQLAIFNTKRTKENTKRTRKAAGFWHLAAGNLGKKDDLFVLRSRCRKIGVRWAV